MVLQERLSSDSRLYNGYEYIRNGVFAKGFPFFDADGLVPGSLTYDGILYPDIELEYDLVLDQLVIRDPTGKTLISLISQKINHFSIGSHYFRYLNQFKGNLVTLDAGIYEQLYAEGRLALYARHDKKLIFPSNNQEQARYVANNTYFLRKDDQFYPVEGEGSLLSALKDKKEALRTYIRANKLHFKRDLEQSLVQTTAYYLQIR